MTVLLYVYYYIIRFTRPSNSTYGLGIHLECVINHITSYHDISLFIFYKFVKVIDRIVLIVSHSNLLVGFCPRGDKRPRILKSTVWFIHPTINWRNNVYWKLNNVVSTNRHSSIAFIIIIFPNIFDVIIIINRFNTLLPHDCILYYYGRYTHIYPSPSHYIMVELMVYTRP